MTRTAPHRLSISLVTLGDPDTLTGGYLYHRRLAEVAPRHGARLVFASFPAWPFPFPLLHGPRMLRVLAGQRADVVVLDSIAAAFLAPWMAGVRVPVVVMAHQPPGGIDHGPVRRRAQAVLDRAAYRRVGRVLVASQLLADQFGAQGFAGRLLVVPPGRDVASAAGARERDLRGGARAALLCVGNWVARKGILQALDAVARLPTGLARLHLVGDERAEPDYAARVRRRLARSDLHGRVECHGRLGREEVAAMYRDADVFVLPSVREPYGTVYGEAMAAGLPVVGWRAGNLPYLAGHGQEGLLAEPGDVAGLAAALRSLAEDEELRTRLGAAARSRAAAFPTWEQTAERFFAAVREAAGRRTARPLPAQQTNRGIHHRVRRSEPGSSGGVVSLRREAVPVATASPNPAERGMRASTSSSRRSGRPLTQCEGRMPDTQRPEENGDEVLNPAMERRKIAGSHRQMRRCRVEEDTDKNINHDKKASCAEKGLQEVHRLISSRWIVVIAGSHADRDRALAVDSLPSAHFRAGMADSFAAAETRHDTLPR